MYNDSQNENPLAFASTLVTAPRQALLVDDNAYNLEFRAEQLRAIGFEPSYALSEFDAVKAMEYIRFEVVFLDVEAMGGFGHYLLPQVAKMEHKPIIVDITSCTEDFILKRASDRGVTRFLNKPVTFKSMCECLRKCELLDPARTFEPPVRPKLAFKNIHFMAQGDPSNAACYLRRLETELTKEIDAFSAACFRSKNAEAHVIIHRLLSLTPLVESYMFTLALRSCVPATQNDEASHMFRVINAVSKEHGLVKKAIHAEVEACQAAADQARYFKSA
jgi:CheY-like chemotaxis protein